MVVVTAMLVGDGPTGVALALGVAVGQAVVAALAAAVVLLLGAVHPCAASSTETGKCSAICLAELRKVESSWVFPGQIADHGSACSP